MYIAMITIIIATLIIKICRLLFSPQCDLVLLVYIGLKFIRAPSC